MGSDGGSASLARFNMRGRDDKNFVSSAAAAPMRNTSIVLLFLTITLDAATPASTCSSVLTDGQLRDFEAMVFPSSPYSPNLGEADGGDAAQGMVKRFTSREIKKLATLAKPRFFAVRDLRSEQDVSPLKEWLKSNPPADLHAWESGVGIIPGPWDHLTADDFLHVMDRSGDGHRFFGEAEVLVELSLMG
jgi:hypothetical protein